MLEWGDTAEEIYAVGKNIRDETSGDCPPIVVMVSGGMDSAVLLGFAKFMKPDNRIIGLSFDYGQQHDKETIAARELGWYYDIDVKTINIGHLAGYFRTALKKDSDIEIPDHAKTGVIPPTYVPFRNAVFLSIACGYAESWDYKKVFYGANAVDYSGYPDCRPQFVDAMNSVTQSYECGIEVDAPIIKLSKSEIVKLGNKLKVPFEKTWSCYRGNRLACGKCPSCELRLKGFEEADSADPISYEI